MSVALSPSNHKKFNAYREILGIMKYNGNSKKVTSDDVFDYLFKHSPIGEEVDEFMQQREKLTRKVSEKRDELMLKGDVQA